MGIFDQLDDTLFGDDSEAETHDQQPADSPYVGRPDDDMGFEWAQRASDYAGLEEPYDSQEHSDDWGGDAAGMLPIDRNAPSLNPDVLGPHNNYGYPSSIDPGLAAELSATDQLLSDTQAHPDAAGEAEVGGVRGEAATGTAPIDPNMQSFIDSLNASMDRAMEHDRDIAAGKYTVEELEEMTRQNMARSAQLDSQIAAQDATSNIHRDVARSEQDIQDRNTAHQYRTWENESRINADGYADEARNLLSRGEDGAADALESAERELDRADHYGRVADTHEPGE